MNSYLTFMAIFYLFLILPVWGIVVKYEFIDHGRRAPEGMYSGLHLFFEEHALTFLFAVPIVVTLIVYIVARFQFFGTVEVIENGLILHAPLSKKRVFLYDELEEFGMDYSWTQGRKTHRLYFCKTPFDPKWRHNILRMSCTKDHMLMAYNETIYRELYDNAPPKVKKRMPMPWHEDSKLEKLYPQKEHVFYVTKAMMK